MEPVSGTVDMDAFHCITGKDISVHLVRAVTEHPLLVVDFDLDDDISINWLELVGGVRQNTQLDAAHGKVQVAGGPDWFKLNMSNKMVAIKLT